MDDSDQTETKHEHELDTQVNITSTEIKVLELMRRGMTNREIAGELNRSVFTIKAHVEHILAKTGARNRAHVCCMYLRVEITAQRD